MKRLINISILLFLLVLLNLPSIVLASDCCYELWKCENMFCARRKIYFVSYDNCIPTLVTDSTSCSPSWNCILNGGFSYDFWTRLPCVNWPGDYVCKCKVDQCNDGSCCDVATSFGSSANFMSGNLFESQEVLAANGKGLATSISLAYNSLDDYTGPLGRGWTHNYNMLITRTSDYSLQLMAEDGRRISYIDDGNGTYRPNAGTGDHSTITISGEYQLKSKDGTTYHFDLNTGKLTSIIDRNSNTFTLTYTNGNLTSITDPVGRVTTITYNGSAWIVAITDHAGRVTGMAYDANGYLSSVTDPVGNTYSYTNDASGKMLTKTDQIGNTTTYTYDGQGGVAASTNASGTKTISYNQVTNVATITERDGGVWTYKYDPALSVPVEITNPYLGKTTYVYDQSRNRISETDPLGNTKTYTYDGNGNMLTLTDPMNNKTTYTYNQWGQVTSIKDTLGNLTSYVYDTKGNPISIIEPSGANTQYQYDSRGNITSTTDAAGRITTIAYDQYGNRISVTDPTGAVSTFTYDIADNMTSQTDALGNTSTFVYNILNQLVRVTDPQGNITTYTYDAKGNRTSVTDANGNITSYEYNYNNQITEVIDALDNVTTYTYGGTGCQSCGGVTDKITSVTDSNNHTIDYEYDLLGKLTKMTDQLGNIETYTYDQNNNLTSVTDRKGQTTTFTYDYLNRLTKATYANGSFITYAYDATGKVTTITDSVSGTIIYTYSTLLNSGMPVGKMINETTPLGSISYAYDTIGRRTSMTVAGQPAVNYTYDADNRLTDINTLINGVAAGFSLRYDALGRRTEITLPNGVTTNYTYDNANRLVTLNHLNPGNQVLESLTYTYDANGNRTSMDRPSVNLPRPDPASNITYNPANQMLTFNNKNMTYDENGNITSVTNSCGTTIYAWDVRNRLVGMSGFDAQCSPLSANFKYDALGRRIEKTINARTIQYLYDGVDIVQEIEYGLPSVNYIRTLNIDEPLARIESNGIERYYQTDALGSVIALTDEAGAIKTQYVYDSFGSVTISGEISDNPFQYTGRENDRTGLYYYRARYYSPGLQRFISEDPIGLEGGINLYSYVGANPINAADPNGLFAGKPGVPPATGGLLALLNCIEKCYGLFVVTATTNDHPPGSPHGRGEAADIRYPSNPNGFLCCASKCGAGCGLDEMKHPSAHSTGPHIHIQLGPCLGGSRGDLSSKDCCNK